MLIDNHGRPITYLRLAVTDRCNLRCRYCMPSEGLQWLQRSDLLSEEEILRLLRIFSSLGVRKLRVTGGEPFLRKDLSSIIDSFISEKLFEQWSVTTNGTLTLPFINDLLRWGVHSVNLSADTFDPVRFERMARRGGVEEVRATFGALLDAGIPTRINAVILDGKNEEDIQALSELSLNHPVDVRFIEEMPFNGAGDRHAIRWNWKSLLAALRALYPDLAKDEDDPSGTSMNYRIPGAPGRVGIIAAWSRTFCGTCNRVRITPKGMLKTCLYDEGVVDLRTLLRSGASDEGIRQAIIAAIGDRARTGIEAEQRLRHSPVTESMATIGG